LHISDGLQCRLKVSYLLGLQLVLEHCFFTVESAEAVDLVLVFSTDFNLFVTLFLLGELARLAIGPAEAMMNVPYDAASPQPFSNKDEQTNNVESEDNLKRATSTRS